MRPDLRARFPFVEWLEENVAVMRQEAAAVDASAFKPMGPKETFTGTWSLLALFPGPWKSAVADVDLEANRARLPKTTAALRQIPHLSVAGLFRYEPGFQIVNHTDVRDDETICAQVGLALGPAEEATWPAGRVKLVDVRIPYSVVHDAPFPRLILALDVKVGAPTPDLEDEP